MGDILADPRPIGRQRARPIVAHPGLQIVSRVANGVPGGTIGFGAEAPPVVYEVDGEEYVAIAAGGTQITGSADGDLVWAFSLKGQVGPLWPPPPPSSVAGPTRPIAEGVDKADIDARNVEYSLFPASMDVPAGHRQVAGLHCATWRRSPWFRGAVWVTKSALTRARAGGFSGSTRRSIPSSSQRTGPCPRSRDWPRAGSICWSRPGPGHPAGPVQAARRKVSRVHTSLSPATSTSMSLSLCNADGVKLGRSVPHGTVG